MIRIRELPARSPSKPRQTARARELEKQLTRNFARVLVRVRAMLGDGNRRTAESLDHLQDAFVEVLRDAERTGHAERVELGDEEQLVRRVAAIARNNIRDAGRKRRETSFESASMTWNDPSHGADNASSPRSRVSQREQAELLALSLRRLSGEERNIVQLRSLEHLSFVEIARRLKRNEDTVRKAYHRALLVLGRGMSARSTRSSPTAA